MGDGCDSPLQWGSDFASGGARDHRQHFTGEATAQAGIDLWFQPIADRIGYFTNSLFPRIVLASSANGFRAQHQLFECASGGTLPYPPSDCTHFMNIGTSTGDWPVAGLVISAGTTYTISISVDIAAKIFRYTISGGDYVPARRATVDASEVTSPFPIVAAVPFFHARLISQVQGGASGFVNGSIASQFDNVNVAQQKGPVLLVGHSYGGMVISEAGNAANVVGLVYIAAFAPETGESVGSVGQVFPAPGALVMAVTQKAPLGKTAGDSATSPAWKSKPSWYQISSEDRMIAPDNQKRMSGRIGARKVITLAASHASLASKPIEVAALIDESAKTTAG